MRTRIFKCGGVKPTLRGQPQVTYGGYDMGQHGKGVERVNGCAKAL
jgi:hypothetical protein